MRVLFCIKERYILDNEQSVKFKHQSNSHASCRIFNLGKARLYLNFSVVSASLPVQWSLKNQHFPPSFDDDTFHFNSILVARSLRLLRTFFIDFSFFIKFSGGSSVYDHFNFNLLRLWRDYLRFGDITVDNYQKWFSSRHKTCHDCVKNRSFFQVNHICFFVLF